MPIQESLDAPRGFPFPSGAPPARAIARPAGRELPMPAAIGIGLLATIATIGLLRGAADSYMGILLLKRGWMQYASLFLAWTALVILAGRAIQAYQMWNATRRASALPVLGPEELADSARGADLRDRWVRAGGSLAIQRARVLNGFLAGKSRGAAERVAEDDLAQAEAALDSGYTVPRVLVWAIPLFGFIGTVVGISAAVAGFSGFLQTAEEIEQIKQGIGGVTTGLAVAFDTTLLSLALSVAVMLPLVLLERLERKLLLALDADVVDSVLSRLPETARQQGANEAAMRRAVEAALAAALPSPEALVDSAREYLERASRSFADTCAHAAHGLARVADEIAAAQRERVEETGRLEVELRERLEARDQEFAKRVAREAESLCASYATAVARLRADGETASAGLVEAAGSAAVALTRVADELGRRAESLESHAAQTSEAIALERSLLRTVEALERTGRLAEVMGGVEASLRDLEPLLARLAQPRRILLVEGDAPVRAGGGGAA